MHAKLGIVVSLSLLACVVVLAPVQSSRAQDVDRDQIAKLKSAFVLNFVRFTTWPDDRFADPNSPIVVTVVGSSRMLPFLRQIAAAERVNSRALEVNHLPYPVETGTDDSRRRMEAFERALHASHVVLLSRTEADRMERFLRLMGGADVLTVSDALGFARAGGMLELKQRRDRVVFDANLNAIKATRVNVSSKVLRLAENVIGGEP